MEIALTEMRFSRVPHKLIFVGGMLALYMACVSSADTRDFSSSFFLPVIAISILVGIFTGVFREFTSSKWQVGSMLLFVCYVIWRARVSDLEHLGWADILLILAGAMGYVFAVVLFLNKELYQLWLGGILILVVGNTGVGIYQIAFDSSFYPLGFFGLAKPASERLAQGFFGSGNLFAGFLNLAAFPLLAFLVFSSAKKALRIFSGIGFLFCCVSMVLTTSRGGALGMFAGVIFLLGCWGVLVLLEKKAARFLPSILGGVFAALVVAGFWFLRHPISKELVWDNLNLRPTMWKWAMIQFSNAPLLGNGSRSYEYLERAYRVASDEWTWWSEVDIDAKFAHNEYLQLLAEYGIIGLLLGFGVVFIHFVSGWSFLTRKSQNEARHKSGQSRAIVVGALSSLIAFGIHSFVEFNLHVGMNCFLFGMILGLLSFRRREPSAVNKGGGWLRRGALVILGLLCMSAVALSGYVGRSWMLMEKGSILAAKGDHLLALSAFSRSLEIWPGNYDSEVGKAYALFDLAEAETSDVLANSWNDAAIRTLESALRKYPEDIYALNVLAQALNIRGDEERAGELFREAIGYAPATRFLRESYVSYLLQYGQISKAVDQLLIYRTLRWSGRRYGEISRRIDELRRKQNELD